MAETIFEQFGGTYTKQGDYLLPNLILSAEEEACDIGIWATRHKRYLKRHHKVLYYAICSLPKNSIPTLQILRNKHKFSFLDW